MNPQRPSAPQSIDELKERADALAGWTVGQLAEYYGLAMPANLKKEKGWVGQLIEWILGAEAGSKPEPDFEAIGVELKTLPISQQGSPLETTFVCVAPLTGNTGESWESSHFRRKLNRVLWVPILAEREIPLAERVIATPFLWTLAGEDEQDLRCDWEELTDMIALGNVAQIAGKHGEYLQLRPKAANSQALTNAFDEKGKATKALPRGFYLRTQFTKRLLKKAFM